MFADALILAGNAAHHAVVPGVGRIACRLRAQNVQVQFQLNPVPCNAQILESRPQKRNRRHVAFERVLGDNLPHYPVGRQYFQNIQVFDHRGDQGAPAMARLPAGITSHLRMRRAIREDALQAVAGGVLRRVSAFLGQH